MYKRRMYYDFIPVDSTRRVMVSKGTFHGRDKIENIYIFDLVFRCKTDLHVGSGELILDTSQQIILCQIKDPNGRPIIPGSTVKGTSSTNLLALSGSSELISEVYGTERNPLISKVMFQNMKPIEKVKMVCKPINRAWSSRIHRVRHVKVYTAIAPPTEEYGKVECIPASTKMRTTIVGFNLEMHEAGGIIASFGFKNDGRGVFKIGYAKPQGFGKMVLEQVEVKRTKNVLENFNQIDSLSLYDNFEKWVKEQDIENRSRKYEVIWSKIFQSD